jgi:hypothetical protein
MNRMFQRNGKLLIVGYAFFVAYSVVYPSLLHAEPTPTEKIAACIKNAWRVNYACQTDGSWINDVFCAIKFEADAILCTGLAPLSPS